MPSSKQRDYLFDNYKAFLIVLVVIGHFIEKSYDNNLFLTTLKWLIVSFHMPAFIFISGYFSKRRLPFRVLISKLVIPYLIFEILYYFLYVVIIHKPTGLYLMYPKFSLWYLQALFFWRVLTAYVKKIPHYMIFTIAAGLLIGCSGISGNLLSIPRTLVFFPFFLAGTDFNREKLTLLRTRRNRILAVILIAAFTVFLILNPYCRTVSPKVFYGRYNYHFLGQTVTEGILCRCVCYLIGFAMTLAVALLMSGRKTCYSYIGTRTMAVYLFHGLVYSTIKGSSGILSDIHSLAESLLLILFCVALVILLSIPQLSTVTAAVSNIQLPAFLLQLHLPHPEFSKPKLPDIPALFAVPCQDPFYSLRFWWVFY